MKTSIKLDKFTLSVWRSLPKTQLPKQFLSLLFFTLLVSGGLSAQSEKAMPQENKLLGAELFYDHTDIGNVKITLRKFFNCSDSNPAKSEMVGIHDKEFVRLISKLELKLEKTNMLTSDVVLDCGTADKECIREVVYSAETYLTQSNVGFDITWGHYFLNSQIVNISQDKKQGISLAVHVNDPWGTTTNQAPQLSAEMILSACGTQKYKNNFQVEDGDGDTAQVALSDLFSHKPVKENLYYTDSQVKSTMPNSFVMENESFVTDRPPFIPISYSSSRNSGITFDKKTKELSLTGDALEEYLIGLSLSDFRDGQKMSEHQAFFIIQIK